MQYVLKKHGSLMTPILEFIIYLVLNLYHRENVAVLMEVSLHTYKLLTTLHPALLVAHLLYGKDNLLMSHIKIFIEKLL